jgi:hypothetical protein
MDPLPQLEATLGDAGVWDKLDVLYIMARDTRANGKINLVDPGTNDLVEVGTEPTFAAYTGFKSAGSGSYLTSINPSLGGFNFTQNDNSIGIWCMDNVQSNFSAAGYDGVLLNPFVSGDLARYRSSSSTSDTITHSTEGRGLVASSRAASTGFACYKNSEHLFDKTRTSESFADGLIRICSWSNGSSNHYDTTRSHAAFFMGASLSDGEMQTIYRAIGRCLQRLGAITPYVTRMWAGAVRPSGFTVCADIEFDFLAGTRTKLVVAADADTEFTTPLFDGDEHYIDWSGNHRPTKHHATGLPANTAVRYKIEVIEP